jgi:hypothetical protein
MSETAYRNWKALNVSRRDQAGGALGPLTNGIRDDMLASVGSVLMTGENIREGRSDSEMTAWLAKDPAYKWVKNVSDADLLRAIDKHYCILDHEPFVAMKFGSPAQGFNPTTKEGDTNYFATAFSAFSDKWLNALKDLKSGGWNDSTRDLRQTFVNALESQPTLHREASTYKTESHELLISYMRSWCIKREVDVKKNERIRAETAAARALLNPPAGEKQDQKYERQIKALRTEIGALRAQGGAGDRPVKQPTPSHVNPITHFYCNGCGKSYERNTARWSKIPCEHQCVYNEHAEHNKEYTAGKAWPAGKAPLHWGTLDSYKEKYHKEMPASGKKFIELRAKYSNANARKRERSSETNP